MRILGIDYGEVRTGIAVSDLMGWTAQAVGTIHERDPEKGAMAVLERMKTLNAGKIVSGLPKNMDGTEGFRTEATYKFADILKTKTTLPIEFWDERLSTVAATRTLNETNVRGKKRKNVIDTVAATYILQGYLDKKF